MVLSIVRYKPDRPSAYITTLTYWWLETVSREEGNILYRDHIGKMFLYYSLQSTGKLKACQDPCPRRFPEPPPDSTSACDRNCAGMRGLGFRLRGVIHSQPPLINASSNCM